jgi:hypothetical protein
MALSGTLDSFPLPEVLRLLGRSGQTGLLLVKADDQEMRGYLQGGRLLFACAGDERAVKSRLVGGGLLDRDGWEQVSSGDVSADELLADDVSPLDYDRAVRSLTVDAFVEIMRRRQGSFEFEEGVTTSIRLGTELSIDDTLDEVDERLRAWNAIREIVPSMTARIHLAEGLPEGSDSVEIDAAEWALIGLIASGTTVKRLSSHTGESEFDAASKVAAFVSRGLAWVGDNVRAGRTTGGLERFPGVEVGDEPLSAEGPTGWTNELDSIAATDEPEVEEPPPLIEDEDLFPSASAAPALGMGDGEPGFGDTDDGDGSFEIGLKGFAPKPGLTARDVDGALEEDDDIAYEADSADDAEIDEIDALEQLDMGDDWSPNGDETATDDSEDEASEDDVVDESGDEVATADDGGSDDDRVDDEAEEERGGALPNLLRRRNKGLLAKELSSLTD